MICRRSQLLQTGWVSLHCAYHQSAKGLWVRCYRAVAAHLDAPDLALRTAVLAFRMRATLVLRRHGSLYFYSEVVVCGQRGVTGS
jgi:hypothetical protein